MAKVAILGTGLSAAFCLLACRDRGIREIHVFGMTKLEMPHGGVIVNPPIPNSLQKFVSPVQMRVEWTEGSDRKSYVQKRWKHLAELVKETNNTLMSTEIRTIYEPSTLMNVIFGLVGHKFVHLQSPLSDEEIRELEKQYDYVFQTFPLSSHRKEMSEQIIPSVIGVQPIDEEDYATIHDSTDKNAWVRATYRKRTAYYEFPAFTDLNEASGFWHVRKVFYLHPNTKPVNPVVSGNRLLIGRFARWDHSLHAISAYEHTIQFLEGEIR